MVGGSIQSGRVGAKNAGIDAVLVDRRDRRTFPKKIFKLSELNKFLEKFLK